MWGGNQGWVSGTGIDTTPCTIGAPCATFQQAFNNLVTTLAAFEVTALDSGSYGSLQINAGFNNAKAFTIDGGEGNIACITAQNIVIGNDGEEFGPGSIVLIRNLTMYGENFIGPAIQLGAKSNGVTVIIENCKIYDYAPSIGSGVIDCKNPANLIIKNTIIEGNNGDAIIVNVPSGGYFSFSELAIKQNSGNALNIGGSGALVDLNNSIITQNSGSAIIASGANNSVNSLSNVFTSNGLGNSVPVIVVSNSALVRISNNDIYNNWAFIGYEDQTGQVLTANDNRTGSNGATPTNPTGSIQIQ